ncbi:hypothetical protein D3C71_1173460 [compost metagenome]
MQAGVHHQTHGAPQLALQAAEVAVRIGVHAQVLAQAFGIQAPAFNEGGLATEATERRHALQFLLQCQLEVMARNGLMQEQVFRIPSLAGRQVVGIDVEDARTGAVFARLHVFATGSRLGAERFNRADFETGLRGQREQLRHAGVDLGFQAAVMLKQLRLGLELELLVGLHELEEVLQRALEAHLLHHRADFAVDALHFLQADLVDLLRRLRGGGAFLGVEGVPRLAVRQRIQAHRVAGGRQVFVGDEVTLLLDRRQQLVGDQGAVSGGQAVLVGLREVGRHQLDRTPELAVLALGSEDLVELRHHLFHQHTRLHHAGLHAFAHVADFGIHQHRKTACTCQPVVVVLHRLERLRNLARAQHHRVAHGRVHLVDRHHPGGELLTFQRLLLLFHEDAVAEQVLPGQAGIAQLLDLGQPLGGEVMALLAELRRAEIRQLVVVAVVTLEGGLQRVQLEHAFPIIGIQLGQLRSLVGLWGLACGIATCGLRGLRAGAQHGGQGQRNGECQRAERHGGFP